MAGVRRRPRLEETLFASRYAALEVFISRFSPPRTKMPRQAADDETSVNTPRGSVALPRVWARMSARSRLSGFRRRDAALLAFLPNRAFQSLTKTVVNGCTEAEMLARSTKCPR